MNKTLPLYSLIAAILLTTAANAQNPAFRHIPPDAENVVHINLSALGSKVSWDDISGMIPAGKSASDQELMKYVKDPGLSGVDFHQGLLVAIGHLSKNADSPAYVTIILSLSDSGKLMSLLRSKEKGLRTIKFPGAGRIAAKDKMALVVDDETAIITIIDPESKKLKTAPAKPGVPKKGISPYYTMVAAKKSAEAFAGYNNSIYTTDANFVNGFSDDADLHLWTAPGSFISQMMDIMKKKNPIAGNVASMPKPKSNMHMLTAFRFDVGKITLRTTVAIPPDSAQIYEVFNTLPLNTDLITHLPGKTVLGMFNLHVAPSALNNLLEHYHTRNMIDSMMAKSGLTIDDFLKALKGDVLIAGMQSDEEGAAKPNIFFVVTIGDMAAFTKVVGKMGLNGTDSVNALTKMKAGFTIRDNILVIGPKGKTDAFFTTNNPANLNLVDSHVKDNAFSLVVDVKAITAMIKAASTEPSQKTQQMLHFLGAVDRLTYAAGNYKNGQSEYYFELKMTDATNNSLRALLNLLH